MYTHIYILNWTMGIGAHLLFKESDVADHQKSFLNFINHWVSPLAAGTEHQRLLVCLSENFMNLMRTDKYSICCVCVCVCARLTVSQQPKPVLSLQPYQSIEYLELAAHFVPPACVCSCQQGDQLNAHTHSHWLCCKMQSMLTVTKWSSRLRH